VRLIEGPKVITVGDADFARFAADTVQAALRRPVAVLGVATGVTPEGLYRELGKRTAEGSFDFSAGALVALDEYLGLAPADPRSYARYVRTRIARPLGVNPNRVLVPNGALADPDQAATAYEGAFEALGGVDLQIVGIGVNGHLGFNEPGADFASATRVVDLTESTRLANAAHFGGHIEDVPMQAITQGLATIMRAREVLLLARGSHKANALKAAVSGPVDPCVPASILQRHPRLTVITDTAAAQRL
jgi:glucosamine-6-phosphate deaminase